MAGVKNLEYRLFSLLQVKARPEIMARTESVASKVDDAKVNVSYQTWHIGSTVCDVLIAVFMSYYVRPAPLIYCPFDHDV